MARQQSRGTCQICDGTFTKSGMSNHLRACLERSADDAGNGSQATTRLIHLAIQDRYGAGYFLHLEMPDNATLGTLDRYLRNIWLECCGHLSEFEFNNTRYISYEEDGDMSFGFFAMPPSESMHTTELRSVLPVGASFRHSYDFGSTTELEGRVVSERTGAWTTDSAVRLLARNLPPQYECSECGKPAAWVCQFCQWDGAGLYCHQCGQDHDCESGGWEMLLPLVNSPRAGVCGYDGGPLT